MIVTAGAGSGKTRVLVERFLRLLEENRAWRVSDILAVTFTEKAAREMVSRIRREIRSRIQQSERAEDREAWRVHRNALDSARIGTIHALCASILRAHPAEAGLDPAFEVMEEIEAAGMVERAVEEALDEAARESNSDAFRTSTPLNLIEIFAYLSTREVQNALTSLIAQGERARRAIAHLENKGPDEVIRFWQSRLDHLRSDAARALIESDSWANDARTITRNGASLDSDKIEIIRGQVSALLGRISAIAKDSADAQVVTRLLTEIASGIILRGGSKKNWDSEEVFNAVKTSLGRMRDRVRAERLLALELNEADRAASEVAARLARLYERAQARLARLKRARARVDFNDLEEITEAMLSAHPEVCARYSDPENGLARAIMIDEFQDTSPIQKKILWMIAPRSDEVFIIGDSKQSIYRFRGADVTVFHQTRAELKSNGGHEVPMDTCFRSHERLIGFVNHLFPGIFTRESRYDTPYEAMSASRRSEHDNPSVELHIITQAKESENRLSAARLREIEARLLARRIDEIISRGERVVCEKEDARAALPGDFALLFQASTSFDIYEQALRDAGVPYVTVAGRGFYDRQEITDITNLLAFLVSSNDNLRLAAALRSPMFALSDETLLSLRLGPQGHSLSQGRSLWKALLDESVEHAEAEREAVRFARETLKRLRSVAGRLSVADVIIAALRETGYLATLMALPHGERRVANVEKFIEQARLLATLTLSELVERTAELKFREAREGEATVEEAGAVRLMTVHKSKGLEFPIVWIVDATYGGGRDRRIVASHAEHGIAVNLGADHMETDDDSLRAASFEMFKRVEERMDAAEKKRLLYVAATRARDHLIISGAPGRSRSAGDHWLGRILAALGVDENERPRSIDYSGGQAVIEWHDADERLADYSARRFDNASSPDQPEGETGGDMFPLINPIMPR